MFSFIFQPLFLTALIAGVLSAITAGLLGQFLVSKQLSHITDGVSHIALLGVFIAAIFPISETFIIVFISILGGVVIEWLVSKKLLTSDASVVLLVIVSLCGVGVLYRVFNAPLSLESALFGSVALISREVIVLMVFFYSIIAGIILFKYTIFTQIVLLGEYVKVRNISYTFYSYLFMIVLSTFIGVSIQLLGGLLISGLLVIPILTARMSIKGWYASHAMAIIYGISAVVMGLILSWVINLSPGIGISVVLLLQYILVGTLSMMRTHILS